LHALTDFFQHLVQHYGLGGLFAAMTLANIGAPVGSEIVLPLAGGLAQRGLLSSLWLAIVVAVAAELVGQSIAYAVGRFGGRAFIERYGRFIHFRDKEMQRVERFFGRYGPFAIFICRFIPVVRGVVGIPAGIAEMPLLPFYIWTFCGSVIFCGGLILLGHSFGAHATQIVETVKKYALLILGLGIVALVVFLFLQSRKTQRNPS
jgi:membrane protein DedA with SNARE-associated domain